MLNLLTPGLKARGEMNLPVTERWIIMQIPIYAYLVCLYLLTTKQQNARIAECIVIYSALLNSSRPLPPLVGASNGT